MKKRFLFYSLFVFISLPILSQDASTSGNCDRVYQTAIRFVVDTPVLHPFTINAEGDQVLFSRGNLQYCPLRDEWRFALRQFDRCGNGKQAVMPVGSEKFATANYGITTVFWDSAEYKVPCNNLLASKRYGGWIDLFPWGTSGHGKRAGDSCAIYFYPYDLNSEIVNATYNTYGYGPSFQGKHGPGALSNNIDKLSGTNRWFDWGYGNVIREYSGCTHSKEGALLHAHDSTMYRPGVWRTLNRSEWVYLLNIRKVNNERDFYSFVRLKYGDNPTDTVTGVIIYPDDFMWSHVGISPIAVGNYSELTEINASTWNALEQAGCVFLPSAGERRLSSGRPYIEDIAFGIISCYWNATSYDTSDACFLYFYLPGRTASSSGNHGVRYKGYPVRLVQDYTPPQKSTPTPTPVPTPVPAPPKEGFSVSKTKRVKFAPGNLQYCPKQNMWRFAERQFDICGIGGDESTVYWDDNGTQRKCDNNQISKTYGGWIDLFGWGTGDNPTNTSTDVSDYSTFTDWGTNEIYEGTIKHAKNTWYTLTFDEWDYLFERSIDGSDNRDNSYSYVRLKYGDNARDTIMGTVIYPDNFTWEDAGVSALVVGGKAGVVEAIDKTTWDALEKAGCVFLPFGYRREGTRAEQRQYYDRSQYGTASLTPFNPARWFQVSFNIGVKTVATARSFNYLYVAYSVRLVKDVE